MPGVSFSEQIKRELGEKVSDVSKKATRASIAAWRAATNASPVRTGNLRAGWKLSTSRRGSYVPRPGVKQYPPTPNFRFRASRDNRVYLYNNVPYASYVNDGLGRGSRTPKNMVQKAKAAFEAEMRMKI